ncbi:MAG: hypothetical protein PHE17_19040 [Thiothrix sp.]|uniref:hypothetical protein n=1 Tax=Thiothrix sp. TaxID=1032 RepID=UPI002611B08E|nr:hypothetical protein [Thiothrix sp.]MDD5395122.1 hypothetical protein [Thiothrix sp.]
MNPDVLVNVIGILYGALLVAAVFIRSNLTEALRIDALFIKGYTENTRPLNLLVGLLVAGYGIYALMSR